MFPNHFATFIWRKKFGSSDFRVFLEHIARVYNPQAQPRFEYAHTQDQPEYEQSTSESDSEVEEIEIEPEPDRVIVHDGRTIDFDQLSDVDDDNEDFDAIAEVEESHEMMMWLWCDYDVGYLLKCY